MTSTGILGKDQSTQYMDPPKGPVYVAIRDWEQGKVVSFQSRKEINLRSRKSVLMDGG